MVVKDAWVMPNGQELSGLQTKNRRHEAMGRGTGLAMDEVSAFSRFVTFQRSET
jgi:hypothetical protein